VLTFQGICLAAFFNSPIVPKHCFARTFGSDVQLTNWNEIIANALNVRTLEISNEDIDAIPSEVFGMANLESLSLTSCGIKSLSIALTNLTNLSDLSLERNRLHDIPSWIRVFKKNLTNLNLCDNRLTDLPDELSELTRLSTLRLDHNPFDHVPRSVVRMLPHMQSLGIVDCSFIDRMSFGEENQLRDVLLKLSGGTNLQVSGTLQCGAFLMSDNYLKRREGQANCDIGSCEVILNGEGVLVATNVNWNVIVSIAEEVDSLTITNKALRCIPPELQRMTNVK
jgi:hypothetical protein